jgi:hypothetical protein
MDIAVRLEGGVGDVLLGNRFVPAIKDKWPDAKIHAFLDTEGNPLQERVLRYMYPYMYESITTIPSKKYKPFVVNTQFGEDTGFGAIENIPDEYYQKIKSHSAWFDFHIDGMHWARYTEINCHRYYKQFPIPNPHKLAKATALLDSQNRDTPNILIHVKSDSSTGHNLHANYVYSLWQKLSKLPVFKLGFIATEKVAQEYAYSANKMPYIIGSIEEVIETISKSSVVIAIDSGIKHIAYCYDIPTITYSQQCYAPGKVLPSHELRWNIDPALCVPLNYNVDYVVNLATKLACYPAYRYNPELTDFDSQAIIRRYSINTEKSVLQ